MEGNKVTVWYKKFGDGNTSMFIKAKDQKFNFSILDYTYVTDWLFALLFCENPHYMVTDLHALKIDAVGADPFEKALWDKEKLYARCSRILERRTAFEEHHLVLRDLTPLERFTIIRDQDCIQLSRETKDQKLVIRLDIDEAAYVFHRLMQYQHFLPVVGDLIHHYMTKACNLFFGESTWQSTPCNGAI